MKKILLSLGLIAYCAASYGQMFPTVQRSLMVEDGVYTCYPCYVWAVPMMDTFQARYRDRLVHYTQERGGWTTALCSQVSSMMLDNSCIFPFGYSIYSPSMFINDYYRDHNTNDSVFIAQASHSIDSMNSLPTVASPIFSVTNIGTDSMVVVTKTKFLQSVTGEYHIGILLLQDSIYYLQTGAAGGSYYHMHQLTGPEPVPLMAGGFMWNGNDSLSYTMANGPIAANTIFTDTFHFKMKPTQVLKDMRPLAIVWKNDTVSIYDYSDSTWYSVYKYLFVNCNENEGFYYPTSTPVPQSNTYTATIYPNPATTTLRVKLEGIQDQVMLNICDVAGHIVMNMPVVNEQLVDVNALSNGSYIYTFAVNGSSIMKGKVEITK